MRITVVLGIVGLASLFSRSSLAADGTSDPDGLPTAPSWLDHVGYQVETGAASTYVFRGRAQYVSRDDASLQSTVALTGKGFGPGDVTLTAWNAQALSARPQAGNASEVDLTPSYTLTIADKWSVSAGYMAYVYAEHLPSQPLDGAHEVFGSLSFLNAWVTPSVGVYAEFVRLDGVYATAGLSRTFTLGPIDVTPQASVGWAAYKGVASRLNDISTMVVAQWAFSAPFYANVGAAYSYMGGPASDVPGQDGSFSGRSVPWAMLAVGAKM
jgi:hypothetical protein